MLIHFSEDGKRLKAIDCFFRLIRPNYLAPSDVVPFGPEPRAWDLLKRIEWDRTHPEFLLLQIVFTKAFESLGLLRKKALNSTQGKGSSIAWFFRRLYWCQRKLILSQRNESAKGAVVGTSGDGGSEMVLALLGDLSVNCPTSGRTNLYRASWFCRSSSVYFARAGVGTGASWSLCAIEPRWAFRQERSTIAVGRSLVLSNWAFLNGLADPLGLEQLEL